MSGQTNVYNYDLKGAHQAIAAAFCEALDLDPDPVRSFDRAALMARVEITKKEAKAVLYGTFNGAYLPASMKAAAATEYAMDSTLSVPAVARRAATRQRVDPEVIYGALRPSLEPVRETMRELVRRYAGRYADQHATYGRGGRYLQNASGIRLNLQAVDIEDHEGRAALACHLLQGTEAAIGHELARLQEQYGYRVVSHEHDGVVTEGRIPPAAVREALRRVSERAGVDLTALALVLKPYDEHEPDHWTDERADSEAHEGPSDGRREGDGPGHVHEGAGALSGGPGEPRMDATADAIRGRDDPPDKPRDRPGGPGHL